MKILKIRLMIRIRHSKMILLIVLFIKHKINLKLGLLINELILKMIKNLLPKCMTFLFKIPKKILKFSFFKSKIIKSLKK